MNTASLFKITEGWYCGRHITLLIYFAEQTCEMDILFTLDGKDNWSLEKLSNRILFPTQLRKGGARTAYQGLSCWETRDSQLYTSLITHGPFGLTAFWCSISSHFSPENIKCLWFLVAHCKFEIGKLQDSTKICFLFLFLFLFLLGPASSGPASSPYLTQASSCPPC